MKKINLSVVALSLTIASYSQTQCEQLTKSDNQCKNITKDVSKLCHLHNPNYVKKEKTETKVCSGTTKSGNKCKNRTKDISKLLLDVIKYLTLKSHCVGKFGICSGEIMLDVIDGQEKLTIVSLNEL